ncbi:nucleolin 2-like [Nicotiana sylvestris]|uniref:nucleolin 2-like n=1 Tax=Nicotiana sylvestris TaxID=4096 RepID=UPI00388C61BD
MLAQKTVASGALRKVLNERLKASQVKESPAPKSDSSSEYESFQSMTEGDGHGSSDSKKPQESPSEVSSSVVENLETRFVLVGPIRDVDLPEMSRSGGKKKSEKEKEREGTCGEERGKRKGAILSICRVAQDRLDENGMKSGRSGSGEAAEKTLTDLLKKVGASYDPKKCKATTPKASNVPKPSKKRKVTFPTPTASLVPRGRATRSKVKQSEADLQKALEESNKRKKDKGNGKVAEYSEAVEEEEMELVHRERSTTVEVPTPKPKKPKTSSKTSSSVPVVVEPTLAKRTRSVVKAKQTKVSDDGDWSKEEEENDSEKEQDKLAIFGRRKILKGRLLKDLVEPGMMKLVDSLAAQG